MGVGHFLKQSIFNVCLQVPLIKKFHRFRDKAEVISNVVDLCEQSLDSNVLFSKAIAWRLRWLGVDFRGLYQHNIGSVLRVLSEKHSSREQVLMLEDQLKGMTPFDLSCEQWLRLNELFCFRGRFPLAQICREHARQLAILPFINQDATPPVSWSNSIAAAIEGGECSDHNVLDQFLNKAGFNKIEKAKWHLLLSGLNGESVPEYQRAAFDKSSYYEFVNGKGVAVVGPASSEVADAKEIDDSDIVVRLNHRSNDKGTDAIHKGFRTDVVYFNGEQTKALLKENAGVLPTGITWTCFKNKRRSFTVQASNANTQCRAMINFNGMTFHGSFNVVPLIVMDLALAECFFVKIFHTDLMLTVSRFKNYHPDNYKHDRTKEQVFLESTVDHDPVLQYRTLQRLWRNKKIRGDEQFERVMFMGLDSYLKDLESVYSI